MRMEILSDITGDACTTLLHNHYEPATHRLNFNLIDGAPGVDGLVQLKYEALVVIFVPDVAEAAEALEGANLVLPAT